MVIAQVLSCDAFRNSPEGFENITVHSLDMTQMEHEVLDWMYMDRPRQLPTSHNHMSAQERNADIVWRYAEGEARSALAKDFGVAEQQVWRIIRCFA